MLILNLSTSYKLRGQWQRFRLKLRQGAGAKILTTMLAEDLHPIILRVRMLLARGLISFALIQVIGLLLFHHAWRLDLHGSALGMGLCMLE